MESGKDGGFQAFLSVWPTMGYLLAMQKVVGSNPISRFQEGLQMVCFSSPPVGWCVCFFGH